MLLQKKLNISHSVCRLYLISFEVIRCWYHRISMDTTAKSRCKFSFYYRKKQNLRQGFHQAQQLDNNLLLVSNSHQAALIFDNLAWCFP